MADLSLETAVRAETNLVAIAGLDEAGRGALAGPVVAGAVILPLTALDVGETFAAVNDSKQLSAAKRSELYQLIIAHAAAYGIGQAGAAVIDEIGIIPATKLAMKRALTQLEIAPAYLLVDGRLRLSQINLPQRSIIRGDSQSTSIAAASILAKVTRDRHMVALEKRYPGYGFQRHKGYGTQHHRDMIDKLGPCNIHRFSFAPIRKTLV